MTPIELVKPWRIIVSLIPCLYGSLLLLELNNTLLWALLAALAMIALLWFVSSLGYPLLLCLPSFAGAFLMVACICMLLQGLPNQGPLPATRASSCCPRYLFAAAPRPISSSAAIGMPE